LLTKHEYIVIARKFTVSALLNFLTSAAVNEWKIFRHGADVASNFGLIASDYSTISKKAKEVPFVFLRIYFLLSVLAVIERFAVN